MFERFSILPLTLEQVSERLLGIVKIMLLGGFLFYMVFALVLVREVTLMTRTVSGALDRPMKSIAWVLFGVAAVMFLLTLVFL